MDPGAGSPPGDERRRAPWERRPPRVVRPAARHEQQPSGRVERARRWALLTGKATVTAVAAAVFLATAAGWIVTEYLDSRFREISALDPDSVQDAPGQLGDENFLIVGSDTRVGAQAGDDVGTVDQVGGARADTIMIAHLPEDRSRAVVVSFPRDLDITRPPCALWDPVTGAYSPQIDPGGTGVKINTAYEVGGPRCLTRVVQQLSGLVVNHFLGVDFQGFKDLVDAVGGVQVCVEQPLEDAELGVILPQAGVATIAGDTALGFVRARNVEGDPTGDYGRIVRQQLFLSSLLRELLSAETVFSAGRLRAVTSAIAANTFGENVETRTLLRLAQSMQGLNAADVTFITVPTVGEANENGNEVLRDADTAALFDAIVDGTPLPGEAPATSPPAPAPPPPPAMPPPTGPALAPEDVVLRVLNASGVDGQAASAARALQGLGFGVLETGNADELVATTMIRYPLSRIAEARTLAAALPDAELVLDDSETGVVELLLGPDFDGTVTMAPDAAAVPEDLTTVNGTDSACG